MTGNFSGLKLKKKFRLRYLYKAIEDDTVVVCNNAFIKNLGTLFKSPTVKIAMSLFVF